MWEAILTSSVLILAILAVRALFGRRVPRRLLYSLWLLVAVRLLVPVSLIRSEASFMNSVNTTVNELSAAISEYEETVSGGVAGAEQTPAVIGGPIHGVEADGEAPGVPEQTARPTAPKEEKAAPFWLCALRVLQSKDRLLLKIVWGVGALAVSGWFVFANVRFVRRLHKKAVRLDVVRCKLPLYWCEDIPSPCLVGLFRPAIYITRFSADEKEKLNDVVTHELCHYAHGDHIWALVRCACVALYWFNPLVWVAARASKADCELACDEAVIHRLGEAHRLSYGRTLVRMIGERVGYRERGLVATTMTSGKKGVKGRIQQIASAPRRSVVCIALLAVLVGAGGVCLFSGATVPFEPQITPPETAPVDPLTGLEGIAENRAGMKPFAFMINNIYDSWPQRGISSAQIIVEIPVEGGLTRMVALYSDLDGINQIGSIRSARVPFIEAIAHVDPVVCEYGQSAGTLQTAAALGLDVIDGGQSSPGENWEAGEKCISVDAGRLQTYAPEHCKFFLPAGIAGTPKGVDRPAADPQATFFRFGDTSENAWDGLAITVDFLFTAQNGESNPVSTDGCFRYDSGSNQYRKFQFGHAQLDDATNGAQLAFDNVFVLYARLISVEAVEDAQTGETAFVEGNGHLQLIDFTHGGAGYYLRGGQIQRITWSKPGAKQGFVFLDENGQEIRVGTGTSYIAIADEKTIDAFDAR